MDRNNGPPPGTHQYRPIPRDVDTPNLAPAPNEKPMRASINIATLNMNGFTAPACHMTGIEKWSAVNTPQSADHKIAILALQETHLDPALLHDIDMCFGKKLTVLNSQDPSNPRATAGVAFIINKTLIAPKDLSTHELIKGRALALKIKWRENEEAVLINVYAPNNRNEHPVFWRKLDAERRSNNVRHPDFMMGNLNVTEDPIDRAPAHADDLNAIEALQNLRHSLDLQDSGDMHSPTNAASRTEPTATGNRLSRGSDRIYTSSAAAKQPSNENHPDIRTNRPLDGPRQIRTRRSPLYRKGRWTMQIPALKDEKLLKTVVDRGMQCKMEPPNKTANPTRKRKPPITMESLQG